MLPGLIHPFLVHTTCSPYDKKCLVSKGQEPSHRTHKRLTMAVRIGLDSLAQHTNPHVWMQLVDTRIDQFSHCGSA